MAIEPRTHRLIISNLVLTQNSRTGFLAQYANLGGVVFPLAFVVGPVKVTDPVAPDPEDTLRVSALWWTRLGSVTCNITTVLLAARHSSSSGGVVSERGSTLLSFAALVRSSIVVVSVGFSVSIRALANGRFDDSRSSSP